MTEGRKTEMDEAVLREQVSYYRARAMEYDASVDSVTNSSTALATAARLLQQLGPFDQMLELACGTGIWTERLLALGRDVTAIDAAPEMLEINARKLANARVRYQLADLFSWEPDQAYDLVFFAFWLSHVPPTVLDNFLATVQRAVRPGGHLAIVDQHTPTEEDRRLTTDGIHAVRPLGDGRRFTIVKVFYDLTDLHARLARLGFAVTTHDLREGFFFLSARRGE